MNKVRGYRTMLGKTQEDMAKHLNISRQAYSEKERSHIPFKDSEKKMIKEVFSAAKEDITIDEIFFA
ncbi:hypothetical protein QLI93_001565 [Listeria monocytogenes]|uniref:helix-turn-helix transcriptional regulator n=1 Tax=Listeria monocytogenes TaxID=1639 RepID=UPI0010D26A38|nr:transcriptional regulator [Listeria monocytogenes]EAD9138939.1 transcriptional regulator [Listeria monocytogenes]EKZ7015208.1 hypothetical protein [Listeria monocytogenes]TYU82208.1 transcriptional regulator [Listeria monocytogenes]